MDLATFRADFPEFADTTAYPDAQVTFWLGIGVKMVDPAAWGDLADFGVELYMAHNLVQAKASAGAAAGGGAPGQAASVLTAKSIDKVSASYDAGATTIEGAGNWNATSYGVRYLQMASLMGAGGAQVY